jgi:hypothetical protein
LNCQLSPTSKVLSISRAQPSSHALPSRTNTAIAKLSKEHTPARRRQPQVLSAAPQPAPDLVPVLRAAKVPLCHTVSMKLWQVSRSWEVFFICCCKALKRWRFFFCFHYLRPNLPRSHCLLLFTRILQNEACKSLRASCYTFLRMDGIIVSRGFEFGRV